MRFFSLGLMSGTSMDAIDAALVLTEGDRDHLALHVQQEYPAGLRAMAQKLLRDPHTTTADLSRVHYGVGEAFGAVASRALETALKKKIIRKRADVLAIGSHGQTVFHHPEERHTMQLGEGSCIAAATGLTTVSDFRMADTAHGGEGAPLLPLYHRRLFRREVKRGIAVHNLGGISNFTYLGPGGRVFALDTGPANCLMDVAIQKMSYGKAAYDDQGKVAAGGKVHDDLLQGILGSAPVKTFLDRPAPKSTGRELFSIPLVEDFLSRTRHMSENDVMATLLAVTVETIRAGYERFVIRRKLPLSEIVFCGGGAKNTFLLERIQSCFPKVELRTMEDYGYASQALEAQAFGVFAPLALAGLPLSHPHTTGCREPAVCGKITPSANWKQVMRTVPSLRIRL
ncbi:MAG: anhydro-N-acetylmuramic acid kinase [Bdellovibrionales bacterium]|nr:anhydro-N-acetylmuramic acid kinase [Bdellovibrionales bacterium]